MVVHHNPLEPVTVLDAPQLSFRRILKGYSRCSKCPQVTNCCPLCPLKRSPTCACLGYSAVGSVCRKLIPEFSFLYAPVFSPEIPVFVLWHSRLSCRSCFRSFMVHPLEPMNTRGYVLFLKLHCSTATCTATSFLLLSSLSPTIAFLTKLVLLGNTRCIYNHTRYLFLFLPLVSVVVRRCSLLSHTLLLVCLFLSVLLKPAP